MKSTLFYAAMLLFTLTGCSSAKEISFSGQWDANRVLSNPHKGWYHHLLDNGVETYSIRDESLFASFPGMDHLYLRLAWSYLEPEEGRYDWHYIDEVVAKYVPRGYGVSFRISSKETGPYPGSVGQQRDKVQYATPYWVRLAGAQGLVAENEGTLSWVPQWNDPVYLAKLDQFHRAFAARYDGKPWVRYVDVGSIGDWGEGHTHFSTKIPPTVAEVKANLAVYRKNYSRSQLVVTDDLLYYGKSAAEADTLYQYATRRGITLRDDSPMVDWYLRQNLKSWSVSHPQFYDSLYRQKPVVLELQHYHTVKNDGNWLGKNGADTILTLKYSGADILRNAMATMRATYIGYHGYAEDWLKDNPDLTRELANRCGYWFFPVKASVPAQMHPGENNVTIEWLNRGVAPAYHSFNLTLWFEAKKPENSFEILLTESGNRNWQPGISKAQHYSVPIPAGTKKGKYLLKFKLTDTSTRPARAIQLGMKETRVDAQGYLTLGPVSVR